MVGESASRFLPGQVREARVFLEMIDDRHHAIPGARDGGIDAFRSEKDDPSDIMRRAARFDRPLQRGVILKRGESIEGGDKHAGRFRNERRVPYATPVTLDGPASISKSVAVMFANAGLLPSEL